MGLSMWEISHFLLGAISSDSVFTFFNDKSIQIHPTYHSQYSVSTSVSVYFSPYFSVNLFSILIFFLNLLKLEDNYISSPPILSYHHGPYNLPFDLKFIASISLLLHRHVHTHRHTPKYINNKQALHKLTCMRMAAL